MNIFKITIEYLRERQPPIIRFLHITIIVLLLTQIIFSNFMAFTDSGDISTNTINFYGTWLHLMTGLLIIPIAFVFLTLELKHHGLKYYYPYLWGDFTQLRNDISLLLQLKLPEPNAHGIAATVQGLGLGALFLVLFPV